MIPYFSLFFGFITLSFIFSLGLHIDPAANFIWIIVLCVFNGLLGGMAMGVILGVMLPNLETVSLALPIVGLPLVMLTGAFVSVKSLIWPLFILSYLSPVRFVY